MKRLYCVIVFEVLTLNEIMRFPYITNFIIILQKKYFFVYKTLDSN